MTDNDERAAPIDSPGRFEDELRRLLGEAYRQDVDVEGGWECRTDGDLPDWDVVVLNTESDDGPDVH